MNHLLTDSHLYFLNQGMFSMIDVLEDHSIRTRNITDTQATILFLVWIKQIAFKAKATELTGKATNSSALRVTSRASTF